MKRNVVLVTSIILIVSLFAAGIVVSKLSKNEQTQGTPVGASNVAVPGQVEGRLVEGFPDFPVYPNAKIINSNKESGKSGINVFSAKWNVGGDNVIGEIQSWYGRELASKGWAKVKTQEDGASGTTLTFSKSGESATVDIHRAPTTEGFKINIVVNIRSAAK